MRSLFVLVLLVVLASSSGTAQTSDAFDKDVYLPKLGNRAEIDSIYGSYDEQDLGRGLKYLPDSGPEGKLIVRVNEAPYFSSIEPSPTFDLHKLKPPQSGTEFLRIVSGKGIEKHWMGRFHSPHLTDILVKNHFYRIYWSDEEGNYDTSRYTDLLPDKVGDQGWSRAEANVYIANLTSDVLDDIVVLYATNWAEIERDTAFLVHYLGGSELYTADTVRPASTELFTTDVVSYEQNYSEYTRWFYSADFRGTGRNDLLCGGNKGDVFHYKNDRPFSLAKLSTSLKTDTLLARWEAKQYGYTPDYDIGIWIARIFTTRALPKAKDDLSVDLIINESELFDYEEERICFFRGGPDFGSKRLRLDSADAYIRHPEQLDRSTFTGIYFGYPKNCGDMTGTGRPVIGFEGRYGLLSNMFFVYVLGDAFDDKADAFYYMEGDARVSGFDTLDANKDGYTDIVIGRGSYVTEYDQDVRDWLDVGTIHLLYGTSKIPLGPNGSVSRHQPLAQLAVYPNPSTDFIRLHSPESASQCRYIIRDVLGRTWLEGNLTEVTSTEIDVRSLIPGNYILSFVSGNTQATVPIAIVR